MPPRNASSSASSRASARVNAGTQSSDFAGTSGPENSRTSSSGRKRKSTDSVSSDRLKRGKKAEESDAQQPDVVSDEGRRPRLTTPDLEFDYDRSQLRDPRPTPGRVRRPRWESSDMPEGFKEQFYVPEPTEPTDRPKYLRKDDLFTQKCMLDPSATFHDLHVCHRKGRDGSPTYDSAGFQLDWEKVDEWMKPRSYNRSRAVKGMMKRIERAAREEREMYEIFFVDGKGPETKMTAVTNYLKDHVSKDLGILWHQIGPKHLVEWKNKGFPKQKADDWWREPNETESRRMLKMMSGASLRKDL